MVKLQACSGLQQDSSCQSFPWVRAGGGLHTNHVLLLWGSSVSALTPHSSNLSCAAKTWPSFAPHHATMNSVSFWKRLPLDREASRDKRMVNEEGSRMKSMVAGLKVFWNKANKILIILLFSASSWYLQCHKSVCSMPWFTRNPSELWIPTNCI